MLLESFDEFAVFVSEASVEGAGPQSNMEDPVAVIQPTRPHANPKWTRMAMQLLLSVRSVAVRDQQPLEEAVATLDRELFNNDRECLAVRYAGHLTDRPFRVTDEQIDELRNEFTDDEIVEMTFGCATFFWGNIIGIALRVDLAGHDHYPPLDWDFAQETKSGSADAGGSLHPSAQGEPAPRMEPVLPECADQTRPPRYQ